MQAAQELQERFAGYAKALALEIAKGIGHADRDELIASAYLGLAQAAAAFDATLGVTFETFAYYRIRGAVFDGLRKSSGLPRRSRARIAAEAAADALVQEEGRAAGTNAEAAAQGFANAIRGLGIVFAASGMDRDAGPEPAAPDTAADSLELRELRERLREAIASLPDELRSLVESLYLEEKSMTECAARLGVHKSTLSRQHTRAIRMLQASLVGAAPT